jgi:hypothetical protein
MSDTRKPPFARRVNIIALEQRMLLDGAAVATAVDVATDPAAGVETTSSDMALDLLATLQEPLPGPTGQAEASTATRHAVFIDTSVEGYEDLVAGAAGNAEVFLLDGSRDGLAQMLDALAGQGSYDSIQVFSHGKSGVLDIGNSSLSLANLVGHAESLADLGSHLVDGGDLLLFGCNIADGDVGQQFVNELSALAGAEVRASTDLTGGAALGGDWDLEYVSGGDGVSAAVAVSADVLAGFEAALATPTVAEWMPTRAIINSDNEVGDQFGYAVAVSDSGWIVAGGYDQTDVYVYKPLGPGEFKEYTIIPPNAATIDANTNGVSVAADGDMLIIGYGRDTTGAVMNNSQTGYVFIYKYNSVTDEWDKVKEFTGTGGFGTAVAIQADADRYRAVIGAPTKTNPGGGTSTHGVVYLTYSTDSGASWSDLSGTNYYIAPPASGTDVDGYTDNTLKFGYDVAIDGDSIVVGAPGWSFQDTSPATTLNSAGRAYVFNWTGTNNAIPDTAWDQLLYPDSEPAQITYTGSANFSGWGGQLQGARFGEAVDIWDDGTNQYIVVGAPGEGGTLVPPFGGESYVFHGLSNGTSTLWDFVEAGGQTVYNLVPRSDGPPGANYGVSVGIDGSLAGAGITAIGAYTFTMKDELGNDRPNTGRVSLHDLTPRYDPNLAGYEVPTFVRPQTYEVEYGYSIALGGQLVAAGSPKYDSDSSATADNNGLVELRLYNYAPDANDDYYYQWESAVVALNVRGNDTDLNPFAIDPRAVTELGNAPAAGQLSIVDRDVTWNPNGEYEYLRGFRNATYTVANDGRITVTSANHNYQPGDWILLQTGADTNPATPSASQHDQLQVVESVIDANTFVLAPDWENTRWSTYTRAAGSNVIRVDANYAHYLEVGDTVWFDYTSGGMTTDKSYTVTNVVDADTFDVVDSAIVASWAGSGTYTKGTGTTTSMTFTMNNHGRQVGDTVSIDFTSGSFTNRDASYAITSVTANTFTVTETAKAATWDVGGLWSNNWNLNFAGHSLSSGATMYIDFSGGDAPDDAQYLVAGNRDNYQLTLDGANGLDGTGDGVGTSIGGSSGNATVYINQTTAANASASFTLAATSGNVTWVATDPGNAQVLDVKVVQSTYTVTDTAYDSDEANITIFVYGENDTVAAGTPIPTQVANAGSATALFSASNPMSPSTLLELGAYTDADLNDSHSFKFDNGSNTITVVSNETGGGSIEFTINATTGVVTFTPTLAQQGYTYTIPGLQISDLASSTNIAGFTVEVERPNSAPVATGGTFNTVAYEDNARPVQYSQTGSTVTVTSTAHGYSAGDVVYLDFINGGQVEDASYVVVSALANSFTVAVADSQSTSGWLLQAVPRSRDMTQFFSDVNNEQLSYSLIGAPSWVTISPTTGELFFNGGNNDIGSPTNNPVNFTVRATDAYLLTADKQVTVTLTPVNDAPAETNEVPFTFAYLGQGYTRNAPIATVPADLFTDIDRPTANTFTVKAYVGTTEITNSAGWGWLRYDSTTRTFHTDNGNDLVAPLAVTGEIYDKVTVRLVATDNGSPNMTSEYTFDINLFAPPQSGGQLASGGANNAVGYAVATSEDGLWMAVGEPEYTNTNYQQGQVNIYRWQGGTWVSAGTIAAPSSLVDGRFGYSLDISANGERLVVGAPGASGYGRVYTFERATGSNSFVGTPVRTYIAGDNNADDMFGQAVALNRDGSKLVVGAPGDDAAGYEAGAVYLYDWGSTTLLDKQVSIVDNGEVANAQHYDRFGSSVAFDGNVVVVGAPWDSVRTAAGQLRLFNGSATVFGVEAGGFNGAYEKLSGSENYDNFGWAVSVDAFRFASGDAENSSVVVAVGAPGSDLKERDGGAVHIYRWQGISNTVSQAQLDTVITEDVVTAFDGGAYHGFGMSVAVDAQNAAGSFANDVKDNGLRLAAGAMVNGDWGGSAYLFRARTDWSWVGQSYFQQSSISTQVAGNQFGWSVALSNAATSDWNAAYAVATNAGRIAIGAPGTDNTAADPWGRRGSIHFASSAGTRIESAPGVMSADESKILADDETVVSGWPNVTPGVTPVTVSSPLGAGGRYDWLDLAPAPAAGEEDETGLATLSFLRAAPLEIPLAAGLAAMPVDDPLLFLLRTETQEAEDAGASEAADPEVGDDQAQAPREPAVAGSALSRQLQVLADRHARASADLLDRLNLLSA